jgi:Cyclin, N-terminal domain
MQLDSAVNLADCLDKGLDKTFNTRVHDASMQQFYSSFKTEEPNLAYYNCLKGHSITPEHRGRLVDWMVEVLTRCGCSGLTFFLAVNIMERYLKHGPKGLTSSSIHLIGVVSMFIASKYQDVQAIGLKLLYEGIAHKKYTEQELLKMEINILIALKFELKNTLSCDFLGYLCSLLNPPIVASRTAEIILILNRLDYNNCYSPCEEAAAALFISAKSLGMNTLASSLLEICGFCKEEIEMCIISMQNYIIGYKIKPPRFKSCMRELGFSFATMDSNRFFKFHDCNLESSQYNLTIY